MSSVKVPIGKYVVAKSGEEYVEGMKIVYHGKNHNKTKVVFITDEIFLDGGIPFYNDYRGQCFYIKDKEGSEKLFDFVRSLDKSFRKRGIRFCDSSGNEQITRYKSMIENDSIRVHYKIYQDSLQTLVNGEGVKKPITNLEDLREHFRSGVKCRFVLYFEKFKIRNMGPAMDDGSGPADFDAYASYVVVKCLQIKITKKAEEWKSVDWIKELEGDSDDLDSDSDSEQ